MDNQHSDEETEERDLESLAQQADPLNPEPMVNLRDITTAIANEEIALAPENKKQANVVLRDIAKTFNKVCHPGNAHCLLQLDLPRPLIRILQFPEPQESKATFSRKSDWTRIPTTRWNSTRKHIVNCTV